MTDDIIDAFARIPHSRTSDEIVQQIELLILEGVLRDSERLPSERDLSRRLDVSRPILREALKELEARGLLVSHHGGGTSKATFGLSDRRRVRSVMSGSATCTGGAPAPSYHGAMTNGSE